MKSKRRKGSVTASDIARKTGLSQSTVSVVLRGLAEKWKISPKTADRVLRVARQMNYVPNEWARNLRRQRSGMIGVILASFRWDWAQELVRGMCEVFDQRGYSPFVAVHWYDPERALRELRACLQRRDEAVIMVPLPGLEEVHAQAVDLDVPIVFVADRPASIPDAHFVAWDSPADTRLAVQHLIATGRTTIGFVGFDYPMPLNVARCEAFLSVLRDAQLPINEQWIIRSPMGFTPDEIVERAISSIFEAQQPPPEALFVQHDGLALMLLDALTARGIRVPDDVALIGMGDYPITRHSRISLSTVREPIGELGRLSAQIAVDLLVHPAEAPIQRLLSCGDLKARESTRPVALPKSAQLPGQHFR